MASTPYARAAHLLNVPLTDLPTWMLPSWGDPITKTPTTLTGCPTGISSYALTIAYKKKGDWFIYDQKNSPTTNRHVKAVRGVIEALGFTPSDETETLAHGMDRYSHYRRYTCR